MESRIEVLDSQLEPAFKVLKDRKPKRAEVRRQHRTAMRRREGDQR